MTVGGSIYDQHAEVAIAYVQHRHVARFKVWGGKIQMQFYGGIIFVFVMRIKQIFLQQNFGTTKFERNKQIVGEHCPRMPPSLSVWSSI